MLNEIAIIVSNMTSHCADIVQVTEESESGIRKREDMWLKTTTEDTWETGRQWRAMDIDKRLQQETLCRRQWTDEYVERPETLMRQNV